MRHERDIDEARSRSALLVLGACVLGCAPSSSEGGVVDETANSSSSTETGVSSTSEENGENGESDASSSTGGPDDTSTDESSGESSGDPVGPIAYCSDLYIGGYDRVNLWRRDEDNDTCALIRLIYMRGGWDGPTLEIDNESFAVERIVIESGAEQCGSDPHGMVFAVAAEGSITLNVADLMWVPDAIDVDATLSFDPVEPWIVSELAFQIVGLVPGVPGDVCQGSSDWVEGAP